MPLLTEAVGLLASLTSFALWLPQAAHVWRLRNDPLGLQGVSLPTQAIAATGAVVWGLYAVLIDSFWVGAPGFVTGPLAVGTIVVVRRSRRVPDDARALVGPMPSAAPAHDVAQGWSYVQ